MYFVLMIGQVPLFEQSNSFEFEARLRKKIWQSSHYFRFIDAVRGTETKNRNFYSLITLDNFNFFLCVHLRAWNDVGLWRSRAWDEIWILLIWFYIARKVVQRCNKNCVKHFCSILNKNFERKTNGRIGIFGCSLVKGNSKSQIFMHSKCRLWRVETGVGWKQVYWRILIGINTYTWKSQYELPIWEGGCRTLGESPWLKNLASD